MEAVVVLGLALLMLWLADRIGVFMANGAVVVLVRGFVYWLGGKLDPWPYGVQEEDRDRPWGSRPLPPTLPTLPSPNLSRVQPAVHTR
jgi:hypothetical protein